jgi:hypothetical protein
MIIDFYTENYGPLVTNVTNKVTFQAWATKERADVYEFGSASLKAIVNGVSTTLINSLIATEHRGKGQFTFKNLATYSSLTLEFNLLQDSGS